MTVIVPPALVITPPPLIGTVSYADTGDRTLDRNYQVIRVFAPPLLSLGMIYLVHVLKPEWASRVVDQKAKVVKMIVDVVSIIIAGWTLIRLFIIDAWDDWLNVAAAIISTLVIGLITFGFFSNSSYFKPATFNAEITRGIILFVLVATFAFIDYLYYE